MSDSERSPSVDQKMFLQSGHMAALSQKRESLPNSGFYKTVLSSSKIKSNKISHAL